MQDSPNVPNSENSGWASGPTTTHAPGQFDNWYRFGSPQAGNGVNHLNPGEPPSPSPASFTPMRAPELALRQTAAFSMGHQAPTHRILSEGTQYNQSSTTGLQPAASSGSPAQLPSIAAMCLPGTAPPDKRARPNDPGEGDANPLQVGQPRDVPLTRAGKQGNRAPALAKARSLNTESTKQLIQFEKVGLISLLLRLEHHLRLINTTFIVPYIGH
jgi:hypothetical protein